MGFLLFFIGICKKARLKEKKREGFHSFIHAKDLSMSTITVPSDVANLLGLGITILLPAVLIGIGVGVWLKRRKR